SSAILVVGRGLHDDRDAAGAISFVDNFFEIGSFDAFAGATLNRAVDVIVRHTLISRGLDRAAKTRVSIRITAAAFRGDSDFLREFAEDLAAFRVDCAFETLHL